MPSKEERINKLIRDKGKLLRGSIRDMERGFKKVENKVYQRVEKSLSLFVGDGGLLNRERGSIKLLNKLGKDIESIVKRSGMGNVINKYVGDFDRVESANRRIYELSIGERIATIFSAEKRLAIDQVAQAINKSTGLQPNIINPIKRMLYTSIITGQNEATAKKQLKALISGDKNKSGIFNRHITRVTRDALNGFDGAINDKIRDRHNLNGFKYIGVKTKKSRSNCANMLSGSGPFSGLMNADGAYMVKDIPTIIKLAKGEKGFNDAITPESFARYRMGHNCTHFVMYVKI